MGLTGGGVEDMMDSLKKHLGLARKLRMPLTPKHHLWMHLVLRIEY